MKIASVKPLHKKGEKVSPITLAHISLLPTLGKNLEKVILKRFFNYFKVFEILNNKQFGFWEKRGTVDTVCNWVEITQTSKHSGTEHTYCTLLDFHRAFDAIDRKILLQKCMD